MSLCINPSCPNPNHPNNGNNHYCQSCGSDLNLQQRYRVMRLLSDNTGFGKVYEAYEGSAAKILKVLIPQHNAIPKIVELFLVSIVVLGDESKSWRPTQFTYQKWGTKIEFNFPVVKLLDYQQEWSGLESSRNPFATVVMAHLKAQETKDSRLERKKWKLALIRRLYEENYSRLDVINLFHFIDWMMSLPEELEREFWQSAQKLEEERRMRYVTSIERIGRQDGIKVGLLKGIELGLKGRFGDEGLAVLPEISELDDPQILETILSGLVGLSPANTLDELRQLYQPKSGEQSPN